MFYFLLFLNFLLKRLKFIIASHLQHLNLHQIPLFHLIVIFCFVFQPRRIYNWINIKFFLLHFLMMTATLVRVSCLDENRQRVEDVIKSSLGLNLKSLLKMVQKQDVFEFFPLWPVSSSFINTELIVFKPSNNEGQFSTGFGALTEIFRC